MIPSEVTFNNLPEAMSQLLSENMEIKRLLHSVLTSGFSAPEQEVMGVRSAAKFLDRTPSAIYNLVNRKAIPHYKKDSSPMFLRSDLLEWVKNGRETTAAENAKAIKENVVSLGKKKK